MILKNLKFIKKLNEICNFIALHNKANTRAFQKNLKVKLQILLNNPKVYRKSTNFNDKNIRDLSYKGYVIPLF